MRVVFTDDGWDDYLYWAQRDQDMRDKVNALIEDARRSPFKGLGKPEPLKGAMQGWWSRRITAEHRQVYRIAGEPGSDQRIEIAMCRYHY